MENDEGISMLGFSGVAARREAGETRARELQAAYSETFGSGAGQRVLADLLECYGFSKEGVECPSWQPGDDAAAAANRDGMKEPVRRILSILKNKQIQNHE